MSSYKLLFVKKKHVLFVASRVLYKLLVVSRILYKLLIISKVVYVNKLVLAQPK